MDFPRQLVSELVDQEINEGADPDRHRLGILEQGKEAHVLGAPPGQDFDEPAFDEIVLAQEGGKVGDSQTAGHGMVQEGQIIAHQLRIELH